MSAAGLLSYVGWTFLPDLCTNYLQSFYYSFIIRAGDQKPPPGSPRFVRDRNRIYLVVIVAYLAYTLYEAHWQIRRDGDFYALLGLPYDVDDKAIQSRFRRLTLQNHPDKISDPALRPAAEAFFVRLQVARDTLVDPAKRFAYDRFGPTMTEWRHCITTKEYVLQGLKSALPLYIGTFGVLVVMQLVGMLGWGSYWRFLTMAALAMFELKVLSQPYFPTIAPSGISSRLPEGLQQLLHVHATWPYLPFQLVQLAHKASFTVFIALARLGPHIEEMIDPKGEQSGSGEVMMARQVQRLEQQTAMNSMETSRLLALNVVPFRETPLVEADKWREANSRLRVEMKEWMTANAVRSDKGVNEAVGKVFMKMKGKQTDAGNAVQTE